MMGWRIDRRRWRGMWALLSAGFLIPPVAHAKEWLFLTGAEGGGGNGYVFGGVVAPLLQSDFSDGFRQRYWVDYLRYEYESGGETIEAEAPGANLALGYQRGLGRGWGAFWVGASYRNTDLSPDDPGSEVRGPRWGAIFQLDGEQALSDRWTTQGIANFTTGIDQYWIRGRLLQKRGAWMPGVEGIVQGNPDFIGWQAGAVVTGLHLAPNTVLGIKGGARKNSGEDLTGYAGVEFIVHVR